MKYLLLLLAFVLPACCLSHTSRGFWNTYTTNPVPLNGQYVSDVELVYIDKEFNDIEKVAIVESVNEWNFALNGYRQYRIVDDKFDFDVATLQTVVFSNQGLIFARHSEAQMPKEMPDGVLAWVDDLGEPVVHLAADRIGTRDLKAIFMHEIGHTMGVPHTPVVGSLMSQYYQQQSGCIDLITVQMLSGIHKGWLWDWHHMNYCKAPI